MSTSIHLCQPAENVSCAACCGIYNYARNRRTELVKRFENRTRLFGLVRQGKLGLEGYRGIVKRSEHLKRVFPTIYSCEFVGYLDDGRRRVGCMLHPASNNGEDLRDASFYGRDICDGHFCPSYAKLEDHEVRVILSCVDDWYLYGALITDIDFVKNFFDSVQNRLGESVDPARVSPGSAPAAIFRRLCGLKLDWPYRDTSRPRFGKYFFVGEDYDIARIDYASLGAPRSPYDPILVSLASSFKNKDELTSAHLIIENLVEGFCSAYERSRGQDHPDGPRGRRP
ncbi:MAG TPA: hypothetical protein PLS81_12450 [Deltaproteobacteria bacterium]|nr:hypothetical protein [Deltaproteobacteria bacterium]HOM30249.1 hypothetical protein [Deltaproteobacteria bacterium]